VKHKLQWNVPPQTVNYNPILVTFAEVSSNFSLTDYSKVFMYVSFRGRG